MDARRTKIILVALPTRKISNRIVVSRACVYGVGDIPIICKKIIKNHSADNTHCE